MPAWYLADMEKVELNASSLTPAFGPHAFVTSIIADCLLTAEQRMREELCICCGLCVDSCPIGAIEL
jgi:ferredoxin